MLTQGQRTTLKALATANTVAAALMESGDDVGLAAWLNTEEAGPVKVWRENVSRLDLFEATPITNFDSLSAGKRAAWELLLNNAPINFSRNKMRSAVDDIWTASSAQAIAILTDMTENATRAEAAIGGNSATNSTVSAIKRNFVGPVTVSDASLVRVA